MSELTHGAFDIRATQGRPATVCCDDRLRDALIEYFREKPEHELLCVCIHCVELRADRLIEFLASAKLLRPAESAATEETRE